MNSKTILCKNWINGQCMFGNRCTYAHGSCDLNENVQLCDFNETCKNGNYCKFRHSNLNSEFPQNIHSELLRRKTILCEHWKQNICKKNSEECAFAHGPRDLNCSVKQCKYYNTIGCKNKYCVFSHIKSKRWNEGHHNLSNLTIAEMKDLMMFLENKIAEEEQSKDLELIL